MLLLFNQLIKYQIIKNLCLRIIKNKIKYPQVCNSKYNNYKHKILLCINRFLKIQVLLKVRIKKTKIKNKV